MENTKTLQPRKMKGKIFVIALPILSILLIGVACIIALTNNIISMVDSNDFSFLAIAYLFRTPAIYTISIIPVFLFVIYVLFCYRKSRATFLLPITFGAACLGSLVYLLDEFISFLPVINYIIEDLVDYSIEFLDVSLQSYSISINWYVINSFSYLLVAVCFGILAIAAFKGFKNKRLAIISVGCGIVGQALLGGYSTFCRIKYVVETIIDINKLENSGFILEFGSTKYLYINGTLIEFDSYVQGLQEQMLAASLSTVVTLTTCFAAIAFLLAVTVLVFKNDFPAIIKPKDESVEQDLINPEA